MTMTDEQHQPPVDNLRAELDAALAEVARLKDIAGRAQADLQNAKQRLEREAADLRAHAGEAVIARILPALDNFQRAFSSFPPDIAGHEWVKGLIAIDADLLKRVAEMGLSRMSSLGEIVDPAKHEAITLGPGKEGIVVEVFEEGYVLNGKVIRHAKVRAGDGSKA